MLAVLVEWAVGYRWEMTMLKNIYFTKSLDWLNGFYDRFVRHQGV
jgi:hypothetical protein